MRTAFVEAYSGAPIYSTRGPADLPGALAAPVPVAARVRELGAAGRTLSPSGPPRMAWDSRHRGHEAPRRNTRVDKPPASGVEFSAQNALA
jgi:hypothetical protein